jgi:hypothetical protein
MVVFDLNTCNSCEDILIGKGHDDL